MDKEVTFHFRCVSCKGKQEKTTSDISKVELGVFCPKCHNICYLEQVAVKVHAHRRRKAKS